MRNHSRQSFLGENLENVLKTKKIAIIGLSGGGSHLVQQIAHIGFRNIVVCDPDHVSESNLNRLVIATLEDAKNRALKVDVAERKLLSLNPDAKVIKAPSRWQVGVEQGLFDDVSLVLVAVDTFNERDQIERYFRPKSVPLIDIGMEVEKLSDGNHHIYGQAIMTLPHGPCLRCLGFLTEEVLLKEANQYGAVGDRPQVVWPNGKLASTAIELLMHYLCNWSGENQNYYYLQYDGNTFEVKNNFLARDLMKHYKDCKHY